VRQSGFSFRVQPSGWPTSRQDKSLNSAKHASDKHFRNGGRSMRVLLLILILVGSLQAADGARILIVTDMEGVGGVNNADEQLLPGQRRFDESRHLLAGELNAAIEGALAAGATEVVVWDGHDGSRSLSIEDIHPRAKLLQGKPTPANYYLSERAYDGIFFIG